MLPLTGRTEKNLQECAAEIKARGGHPITVQMDHGLDSGEGVLFSQILFRPSDLALIDLHNFFIILFLHVASFASPGFFFLPITCLLLVFLLLQCWSSLSYNYVRS